MAAVRQADPEDAGAACAPADRLSAPPDLSVLTDPARVAAVERLIAAGPSTGSVQRLTGLAAQLLNSPCAQVSLLAEREQVVVAAVGVPWIEDSPRTPATESLCSVTVALGRPLVVEEAAGHPWVYDLPPVTSGAVSSYLGVVLTDAAGHMVGSLCVYGDKPRTWRDDHCETLTALAEVVAAELEEAVAPGD